jgi:hypothetical protein
MPDNIPAFFMSDFCINQAARITSKIATAKRKTQQTNDDRQ